MNRCPQESVSGVHSGDFLASGTDVYHSIKLGFAVSPPRRVERQPLTRPAASMGPACSLSPNPDFLVRNARGCADRRSLVGRRNDASSFGRAAFGETKPPVGRCCEGKGWMVVPRLPTLGGTLRRGGRMILTIVACRTPAAPAVLMPAVVTVRPRAEDGRIGGDGSSRLAGPAAVGIPQLGLRAVVDGAHRLARGRQYEPCLRALLRSAPPPPEATSHQGCWGRLGWRESFDAPAGRDCSAYRLLWRAADRPERPFRWHRRRHRPLPRRLPLGPGTRLSTRALPRRRRRE